MYRARIMVSALVLAMASAIHAQDIGVLSDRDAEAMLADKPNCAGASSNSGCDEEPALREFAVHKPHDRGGGQRLQSNPSSSSLPRSSLLPLQFAAGAFDLSPQSRRNLQTLARAMSGPANAEKRILISGHTDRSGSLKVNRRLSQRRAEAARSYLISLGISPERVQAIGKGYGVPLPDVSIYSPAQRRIEVNRIQ